MTSGASDAAVSITVALKGKSDKENKEERPVWNQLLFALTAGVSEQ